MDDALACLSRARECLHAREFETAELLLRRAIAQDPNLALAYELLGKLLYRDARAKESAAVYRAWLEAMPSDPIAAHLFAATGGATPPERALAPICCPARVGADGRHGPRLHVHAGGQ